MQPLTRKAEGSGTCHTLCVLLMSGCGYTLSIVRRCCFQCMFKRLDKSFMQLRRLLLNGRVRSKICFIPLAFDSVMAHLCNLAVANAGSPTFGLKMEVRLGISLFWRFSFTRLKLTTDPRLGNRILAFCNTGLTVTLKSPQVSPTHLA